MSTTFTVYPGTSHIPTFREVTELASRHLRDFLGARGLDCDISLSVALLDNQTHERADLDPEAPAIWDQGVYAWFTIPGVGGGTDAYFSPPHLTDPELRPVECPVGHCWMFRRSAGQPALVTIGYGLLACALAELTDGVVYTDDGAWDYRRFPARPADMLTWYFVPELADDEDDRDWALRVLSHLPHELREAGYR